VFVKLYTEHNRRYTACFGSFCKLNFQIDREIELRQFEGFLRVIADSCNSLLVIVCKMSLECYFFQNEDDVKFKRIKAYELGNTRIADCTLLNKKYSLLILREDGEYMQINVK